MKGWRTYLEDCDAQSEFAKQMLCSAGTGEGVQRIREAFGLMPNLSQFSWSDFEDGWWISNHNGDIGLDLIASRPASPSSVAESLNQRQYAPKI